MRNMLCIVCAALFIYQPTTEAMAAKAPREKLILKRSLTHYKKGVSRFKRARNKAYRLERVTKKLQAKLKKNRRQSKRAQARYARQKLRLAKMQKKVQVQANRVCTLQNKTKGLADALRKNIKKYCGTKDDQKTRFCTKATQELQDWWRACRDGQYDRRDIS